jgi:hypothetical protein
VNGGFARLATLIPLLPRYCQNNIFPSSCYPISPVPTNHQLQPEPWHPMQRLPEAMAGLIRPAFEEVANDKN